MFLYYNQIKRMSEYIELVYKEITSRNPVDDKNFPQGLKDFKFSIGQGYGFIPAKSYFKIELEIVKYNSAGAAIKPDITDGVTFADGVCGNLFNNIYFNMGGQTVSSITTGLSQCDILKNRLTKSKAWNETIGLTQGFNPTYFSRNDIMNKDEDVCRRQDFSDRELSTNDPKIERNTSPRPYGI